MAEPDSIKCSQLHGPRTVLIGDAAHCAAPVLGQGANSALEDVSVLVDTLRHMHELRGSAQEASSNHPSADAAHDLAAFTRARKHDVHALIDLNRYVVLDCIPSHGVVYRWSVWVIDRLAPLPSNVSRSTFPQECSLERSWQV